jgi:outer membrane biosynthesis protein TonB
MITHNTIRKNTIPPKKNTHTQQQKQQQQQQQQQQEQEQQQQQQQQQQKTTTPTQKKKTETETYLKKECGRKVNENSRVICTEWGYHTGQCFCRSGKDSLKSAGASR